MSEFPAVIDLATLDGSNGFRLDGSADELSGSSVASAGDINGDGFDDLIIGAPGPDGAYDSYGDIYVMFGKADGFSASLDLADLDGSNGFLLDDTSLHQEQIGRMVASGGDVNGDGFDDLIIGARGYDYTSEAYVVFGKAGGFGATFDVSDLDGSNGFHLHGVMDEYEGWSVASAGDVNGDGFDDLLIGTPTQDYPFNYSAGKTYVVFGHADGFPADLNLSSLNGSNGFRLDGIDVGDRSGASVASAGDVNGDDFDDLIIGAPGADPDSDSAAGETYVVFGHGGSFSATFDLADLDGSNGFRIDGIDAGNASGISVASAGDVNGDGFADLIIGAPNADPGGYSAAGVTYVVFGKAGGFSANLDLAALDGSNGFRLTGIDPDDLSGRQVASAGDVNGDGFDDLIIGARQGDPGGDANAGEAYVVFGKADGFAERISLGDLDGDNGFRLRGIDAGDMSGWSVASAGDVNGDGFDDIIIGAPGANGGAGESYVVFGHRAETAVNRVGTAIDNRINGGMGDDTIAGLGGNDTIIGWEGDDTIAGGAGDDRIVAGAGNDSIDGGGGRDTLSFEAFGSTPVTFNLLHAAGIFSIEDLAGGAGGDTLFGNNAANVIRGGLGHDRLGGGNGADTLIGNGGNDSLNGGNGIDTITGGMGADSLTGKDGSDVFRYTDIGQSSLAASDTITDFTAGIDRIDVKAIDAIAGPGNQAFTFIGTGAFTAEGQVRLMQSGADTIVEFNVTGTSGAEMAIALQDFIATNLTAADFVL